MSEVNPDALPIPKGLEDGSVDFAGPETEGM